MRSTLRAGLASSLVVLAGLSMAAPAFADIPGIAPYEVEAKLQYCANGGSACAPTNGRPDLANLRFAYVDLIRVDQPKVPLANLGGPGGIIAEPQLLIGKCAGPHFMDAKGNIHTTTMFAFVGSTSFGYDGGNPDGIVVLRNGQATSANAEAFVAASGKDPQSGDTGSIVGSMVANNATNTLVRGGFQVSLSGPQYDEIVAGPDASPAALPTPLNKSGAMTCNTDHTPVAAGGAPPAFFQAQKDAPPNPNS